MAPAGKAASTLLELQELLDQAGHDRGTLAAAVRRSAAARRRLPVRPANLAFEFLVLEAIALNQLGENAQALVRAQRALRLRPHHLEALLEQAMALFELSQFPACGAVLRELRARAPDEPWIHHHLGLIEERNGQRTRAARHFARARSLDPRRYPGPLGLSDEEFEASLLESLRRLPPIVAKVLEDAVLRVDVAPGLEVLHASRRPLSPHILGVCQTHGRGFPRSGAVIVLFRGNLEHFARSRSELVEQLGITLMHEVGHLLGLGEPALYARGLE